MPNAAAQGRLRDDQPERANDEVAPRLGRLRLPVIKVSTEPAQTDRFVLWKTVHLGEYVRGCPSVWLDDHPCDLDSRYLAEHGAPRHLIIQVDPGTGLQDHHLRRAEWLHVLAAGLRGRLRYGAA